MLNLKTVSCLLSISFFSFSLTSFGHRDSGSHSWTTIVVSIKGVYLHQMFTSWLALKTSATLECWSLSKSKRICGLAEHNFILAWLTAPWTGSLQNNYWDSSYIDILNCNAIVLLPKKKRTNGKWEQREWRKFNNKGNVTLVSFMKELQVTIIVRSLKHHHKHSKNQRIHQKHDGICVPCLFVWHTRF